MVDQVFFTNYKTYTTLEVIDTFYGEIQAHNQRALMYHLTNPDKATHIQSFLEANGELFIHLDSVGYVKVTPAK